MRLPRMRRWMIAVGVVALTFTSMRLWERSLCALNRPPLETFRLDGELAF